MLDCRRPPNFEFVAVQFVHLIFCSLHDRLDCSLPDHKHIINSTLQRPGGFLRHFDHVAQLQLPTNVDLLILLTAKMHPIASEPRLFINFMHRKPPQHSCLDARRCNSNEKHIFLKSLLNKRCNCLESERLRLEFFKIIMLQQWVRVFVRNGQARQQHSTQLDSECTPELEVWPIRLTLAPCCLSQSLGHKFASRVDLVFEARGCVLRRLRSLLCCL
mmetsp:Transcript_10/g.32  ORF Transcript_10/g.32 Transcript_10/m.32 type:complete len:217 (-) Transcript_10:475-1125(-)